MLKWLIADQDTLARFASIYFLYETRCRILISHVIDNLEYHISV